MARRKRKLFYWIERPGKWWCAGKWISIEEINGRPATSVRSFKTKRAAWRHALFLESCGLEF